MASVTRLERDSTLPLGTATVQRLERLAGTRNGLQRGCVRGHASPRKDPHDGIKILSGGPERPLRSLPGRLCRTGRGSLATRAGPCALVRRKPKCPM